MPFDILEHMDYVGVKCTDCGKVVASHFCGQGINVVVSEEDFYKIQRHKCKNKEGKWYLTYQEFCNLENHKDAALIIEKVELKSSNKAEAIKEAKDLWKKRIATGKYKGWDDIEYPNSPKLIYEDASWSEKEEDNVSETLS